MNPLNGLLSVHSRWFAGHESDHESNASWEENLHEIYAGKRTQKYNKDDKER